jgi:hypothetical protein
MITYFYSHPNLLRFFENIVSSSPLFIPFTTTFSTNRTIAFDHHCQPKSLNLKIKKQAFPMNESRQAGCMGAFWPLD